MSSPDGRQLLMILNTTKKDAGLYECVATNPLASVTSSCTISLACESLLWGQGLGLFSTLRCPNVSFKIKSHVE